MGCTLNLTSNDFEQILQSVGVQPHLAELLDKSQLEQVKSALYKSSSQRFASILTNPDHPSHSTIANIINKSLDVMNIMTEKEKTALPKALGHILKRHPSAMGLIEKPPAHRGPGASKVQHFYEVLSAAALMVGSFKTTSGKSLSIGPGHRVDFGIKYSKDYAQPKHHGTIEGDIVVTRGLFEKTLTIDAKHSKTGIYNLESGFQRELDGIRTGFRDGKIEEFCFVTKGIFGDGFKKAVDSENLEIARDYAKKHNRLYHQGNYTIDRNCLTEAERAAIPPGKIPEAFFDEFCHEVREFIQTYDIPQIDVCEHVRYPGT